MEEEKIDQVALALDVANHISYEFFDFVLVKPLEPVKVKKEFSKPVSNGETEDKNGVKAQDFDKVETEVKEVDSDYRKGIVLKLPTSMETHIAVGDVVLFRETAGLRFDLVKDSRLLRVYEIIGTEK